MNFFRALGLFGFRLLRKIILDQEVMIEHVWVCETHARTLVNLLAHASQGLVPNNRAPVGDLFQLYVVLI